MSQDVELLHCYARTRDAEVFDVLVGRYADFVYGICFRVTNNVEDAQDAAQDCFLALARQADTIRTSLPAWLHRVAYRCAASLVRREVRRRHRERQAVMLNSHAADSGPKWEEIAPHVDRALEALPEQLRDILARRFLQRKTQAEIAKELGLSASTISRRIKQGVARLRGGLRRKDVLVPAALLATLLSSKAAIAAPPTLTVALGKMAMAGVGGSTSAVGAGSTTGAAASTATAAGTAGGVTTAAATGKTITGGIAMKIGIAAAATVVAALLISQVGPGQPEPPPLVSQARPGQPEPAAPPVEAATIGQNEQVDPTLARARELCAQLRDRDKRKDAFAELFALQEKLDNPVTIEDPLLGKGELREKLTSRVWGGVGVVGGTGIGAAGRLPPPAFPREEWEVPPGYLHDDASGIAAVNHTITVGGACAFLLDRDGRIFFVGTQQSVTALLDADRDGSLKFTTIQTYNYQPLLERVRTHTYRVYRLREDKVELEMCVLTRPSVSLRFGDADGSQPAWVELLYDDHDRRAYYFWKTDKNAYVGPEGGLFRLYQVVGGKRFVADPRQSPPANANTLSELRKYMLKSAFGVPPDYHRSGQMPPLERMAEEFQNNRLIRRNGEVCLWYLAALENNEDWIEGTADILSILLGLDSEDSENREIQTCSAFLLGKIRHKPSAAALWALAENPDNRPRPRTCAIWALARTGDGSHFTDLQEIAKRDKSEMVRGAAIYALALLAKDAATVAADEELPNPYNRKALDAALEFWKRSFR